MAVLVALAMTALAWHTPDRGNEYDLDGLVDISEGAVTGANGTYVFHENITISRFDALTIGPGNTIWMTKDVLFRINGTITVEGETDSVVRLTSAEDSPSASDWWGLDIWHASDIHIRNCSIEYAFRGIDFHFIEVLTLDNVTFNSCDVGILGGYVSGTLLIKGLQAFDMVNATIHTISAAKITMLDSNLSGNIKGLLFIGISTPDAGEVTLRNVTATTGVVIDNVAFVELIDVSLPYSDRAHGIRIDGSYKGPNATIRNLRCSGSVSFWNITGNVWSLTCGEELHLDDCDISIFGIELGEDASIIVNGGNVTLDSFEITGVKNVGISGMYEVTLHASNATISNSEWYDLRLSKEVQFFLHNVSFGSWSLGNYWGLG